MKELICIVCPKGCHLKIDENLNVTGNGCNRGIEYGINELTNPTRMVTSTVVVLGGELSRCSVATSKPIPKNKIFDVMNEINISIYISNNVDINHANFENNPKYRELELTKKELKE